MAGAPYTVRCMACGARNRIPVDRADHGPRCGKCKAPIDMTELLDGRVVEVSDSTFETRVLRSPLPVLLDCWAPWCGPCRMVGPVIEELAAQWKGRVRAAKLNVDENPAVAGRFGIRSIPTLLVFDGGELKDTMVGALPKTEIAKRMAPFVNA